MAKKDQPTDAEQKAEKEWYEDEAAAAERRDRGSRTGGSGVARDAFLRSVPRTR